MKSVLNKVILFLAFLLAASSMHAQKTVDTLFFRSTPVLIDEFVFVTDTLHVAWYPDTLKCFTKQHEIHQTCDSNNAAFILPDHIEFNLTTDSIYNALDTFQNAKFSKAYCSSYSTTAQLVAFSPEDMTKPLPKTEDQRIEKYYYAARIQYLTNLLQANPDSCSLYRQRAKAYEIANSPVLNIESQYSYDLVSAIQCDPHDVQAVLLRSEQLVTKAKMRGAMMKSTQCVNHSIIDHTYLKEAVDLLEKSLTFNPQSPELIHELNKCYSLQKGDF